MHTGFRSFKRGTFRPKRSTHTRPGTPPRPHDVVSCTGSALERRGHGSAPTPLAFLNAVHRSSVDGCMVLAPPWNVRVAPHATEQQNGLARECGRSLATPTPPPRISLAPDPPDVRRTSRRRKFVSASTHALVCRLAARVCTRAQVLKAESARSADETGGGWLIVMTVRCCSCSSR